MRLLLPPRFHSVKKQNVALDQDRNGDLFVINSTLLALAKTDEQGTRDLFVAADDTLLYSSSLLHRRNKGLSD
ncbi:uncharacterized protein BT62DRAFT_938280 [Guyanagaster necrorhizus]|uniref:Uncharacterized protein n=1 Tax=Guyanagaster necrorhizus TaxID=856835 RepID=A0A9P8AMU9_9AGAR|nr:uncharacterized protein BT62DRAFT_938280 [Guyanagaster necrorhizus MCA 3950]KAG7440212.1 hypothetical protein BT62DRAFT_938280 [Guyanagaster necrorhizus MCA 3950]